MATHENKYTVHQRLTAAESAVTELRAELARTHTHVVTELKNAVSDTCGKDGRDGVNGVCACKQGLDGRNGKDGRDGAAGKDGRSIQGNPGPRGEASQVPGPAGPAGRDGKDSVVPGPKGERGDVCYIGPDEVAAAVAEVRKELLRLRAATLGRLAQGIADHQGDSGTLRYVRMQLEKIKKDIESL
jgi:hypothetical protein